MRLPSALLLVLLLLAGCNDVGDPGAGPGDDDTDTGPSPTAPSGLEGGGDAPDPAEGFAVLVATGRLEGEGPPPGPVAVCSPAPPDGHIDVDSQTAWAKPGQHSFKAGKTWLLVLDEVEADDPRQSGCGVRTLTPFTVEGNWHPQAVDPSAFRLDVTADGERLLLGRNAVEPGGAFETYVEFEDGDYTFSGDLTFTHAGWWQPSAFQEKDGEVAPEDGGAVWWVDPET